MWVRSAQELTATGSGAVLLTTADYLCGRIPTHTLSTMKCGQKIRFGIEANCHADKEI